MKSLEKHFCPYCMSPVPPGESCPACRLTAGNYVPSPHHLPPGTVLLGRYLVGRVLGEGGFGITYIGCDLRLELKVAIKEYYPVDRATRNASASLEVTSFIGPSSRSFERGKHKFLDEAQIMARMDKQQVIVSVRDFFEVNNTAYIVMEYIEGTTFRDLVEQRGGGIPPEELFVMIEPLFKALSHMHEAGLIHRDISPDNLMLESGRVRLLDFGCAREATHGTETMTIALKHGYAPLEQYQQKGQGPWTDIYALCATIYYCLTGKAPPQALDRIAEDNLLLPSKLGIALTPRQERALLKGLSIQPRRRFQTVEELHAALYEPEEPLPVPTSRDMPPLPRGRKPPAPAGLAGERNAPPAAQRRPQAAARPFEPTQTPEQPVDIPAAEPALSPRTARPAETGPAEAAQAEAVQAGTVRAGAAQTKTAQAEAAQAALQTAEPPAADAHMAAHAAGLARPAKPGLTQPGPVEPARTGAVKPAPAAPARKRYALVGVAAAALALTGLGWWLLRPAEPAALPSFSAAASAAEGDSAEEAAGAQLTRTASFDGAAVLQDVDAASLQALLEDASVPAVVLDAKGTAALDGVTLTKPVRVAGGTTLQTGELTIAESGYLQVDGVLELSGYLRVEGDDTHLYITQDGQYNVETGVSLVWVDDRAAITLANGQRRDMSCVIECAESVFDSAKHVTTLAQLRAAAENREAVVIDADLTLTEDIGFSAPVKISEGVTVAGNGRSVFCVNDDYNGRGVLFNYGTLQGGLYASGSAGILNFGTLTTDNDTDMACSLWLEQRSRLLNLGTLNAYECSRLWDESVCMNLGTVNAYDFLLMGASLTNRGSIQVYEYEGANFCIENGGTLYNDSEVTIHGGAEMDNCGWVRNRGTLTVEQGGKLLSAALYNLGTFRAEDNAELYGLGAYFGSGTFDVSEYVRLDNDSRRSFAVYDTAAGETAPENRSHVKVRSAEQLEGAMEPDSADCLYITEDITVEHSLVLRDKTLYVGAKVDLVDGADLAAYHCTVVLLHDAGSLNGSGVTLAEGSTLKVEEGASLTVAPGGTLALNNALLWGDGGRACLDGAELLLRDGAAVAMSSSKGFSADNAQITVGDEAVLLPPYAEGMTLTGADISLEGGWLFVTSDTTLSGGTLDIRTAGQLRSSAENLTLRGGNAVTIRENGEVNADLCNVSVQGDSTVENRGCFSVNGWDEYCLTLRGPLTNYGEAHFNIRCSVAVPVQNQGTLYYRSNEDLDTSMVQGSRPRLYD